MNSHAHCNNENTHSDIPKLIKAEAFPPVFNERFALKLLFDNGECKKYVLPINHENENDDSVTYCGSVFTDKIWNSFEIINKSDGSSPQEQIIMFENGFSPAADFCLKNGTNYEEPIICNDTIYEDDEITVKKLWTIKADFLSSWNDDNIFHARFSGEHISLVSVWDGLIDPFDYCHSSTYVTSDGKRLTSLDFDYTDFFCSGLAVVGIKGRGYGYINTSGELVIPPKYELARNFNKETAIVKRNGIFFIIDKNGNEYPFKSWDKRKYESVEDFYEGLCKVSTLYPDFAYNSDCEPNTPLYGYVDETGAEVISPQYTDAHEFEDGIAFVCIEKPETGDNSVSGKLWGAIDKTGKEVIPFMLDEIKTFVIEKPKKLYIAHFGGWDNGKWGVIDQCGKWVAPPVFHDIDRRRSDELIIFYSEDSTDDEPLMGVYDTARQKVLLEPQFSHIHFDYSGNIHARIYDERLGREAEKLLDRNGKEIFPSDYSMIDTDTYPYKTEIFEPYERKSGTEIIETYKRTCGLIDKAGNVILPCEFEEIFYEQKAIVFKHEGKCGLMDFDRNIILPPIYDIIMQYPYTPDSFSLLYVTDKNFNDGLIKFDGTTVIEPQYSSIFYEGNGYFLCSGKNGYDVFRLQLNK